MVGLVVAVDGPSGSGKSTASRAVAASLGLRYLDTGAMFRAITWAVLRDGVDPRDQDGVARVANSAVVDFTTDPEPIRISVDGVDVTNVIRETAVTAAVSAVSAVPAVRERLAADQRRVAADAVAAGSGVVMEGRDIGTVVLPDADVKIYLTADLQARAARRAAEQSSGNVSEVHASLLARDRIDTTRATAPLVTADDAVVIDATYLTLNEVIDAVLEIARQSADG